MSDEINISTKEQPGDYDAVETAKPGEPIFALQGGDPLGPPTVLFWADEARKLARQSEDEKEADKLFRKATSAEQVAWAMMAYQRGEQASPRERDDRAAELEDEAHKWRPGLIGGVKHLNEAAYHFTNAAEHLPDDQARAIAAMVDQIKVWATAYSPKRASYPDQPELPIA